MRWRAFVVLTLVGCTALEPIPQDETGGTSSGDGDGAAGDGDGDGSSGDGDGSSGDGDGSSGDGDGSTGDGDGSSGDGDGSSGDGDGALDNRVIEISSSRYFNCVVFESGDVRCWGYGGDGDGALGYGNAEAIGDDETPASAGSVNVGGPVATIATGEGHVCAALTDGRVRCWGSGSNGKLGYGNTDTIGDDEHPASAGDVDVGGVVVDLAAGTEHTCALLGSGSVRCWGLGGGQLGYGNTESIGDDESPAAAGDVAVGGTVVQLAAGPYHTCARLDDGSVRCWGDGSYGQLGLPGTFSVGSSDQPDDHPTIDLGGDAVDITAGYQTACAVLAAGGVRCWGFGAYGQLGYANQSNVGDNETPASVGDVDLGGSASDVTQGLAAGHTCATLFSGNARCWGLGGFHLGYGTADAVGDDETPSSLPEIDLDADIVDLAVGATHTCALVETGSVRCWGWGDATGVLGYLDVNLVMDPATAPDVDLWP